LEQLKQRLDAEGAFDPSRRRPIPFLPQRVALITSPTGAVIHDLQETIWDRFPNMEIVVYPAQVQGTASPGSVAAALRRCNQDGASVAVIARGGGSFEELYAFNTEPVARAILASVVPVVTALGHTSDRTIADMVADAECRTPTEAGARVVPKKADLLQQLAQRERRVEREVAVRLKAQAEALRTREHRLKQVLPAMLRRRVERLDRCRVELGRLSPIQQVTRREEMVLERGRRLETAAQRLVSDRRLDVERRRVPEALARLPAERLRAAERALSHRRDRLAALSPEAVLKRGYSITHDSSGRVLRSVHGLTPGDQLRVRLAAGSVHADVRSTAP
jgi:exodeoxyribonuclease VII large subunit